MQQLWTVYEQFRTRSQASAYLAKRPAGQTPGPGRMFRITQIQRGETGFFEGYRYNVEVKG